MIKLHTNDGQTNRIDLGDEQQAREWLKRLKDAAFQKTITGVSVLQKCGGHFRCPACSRSSKLICSHCGSSANQVECGTGVQFSLSRPIGMDGVFYLVENIEPDKKTKTKGGEKVTCFAGENRLTLMVHRCQSAAKISLSKTGKQRFNPNEV